MYLDVVRMLIETLCAKPAGLQLAVSFGNNLLSFFPEILSTDLPYDGIFMD